MLSSAVIRPFIRGKHLILRAHARYHIPRHAPFSSLSQQGRNRGRGAEDTEEADGAVGDQSSDMYYREKRLSDLAAWSQRMGQVMYPDWRMVLKELGVANTKRLWSDLKGFHRTYHEKLQPREKLVEEPLQGVVGRIVAKRQSSQKLCFYTVVDGLGNSLQLMATAGFYVGSNASDGKSGVEEFGEMIAILKRGDVIAVSGIPAKTGTGELSIVPYHMRLLSPCLHQLPHYGVIEKLQDNELRYRNRHVDFMVNGEAVRKSFRTRAQIIRYIRRYLDDQGFLEVETPTVSAQSGGANAKPFETHLNAMNLDLKLRIAPELYLKQLVVGGFDRVYELGRVFRNEGVDATHNPEFTTCEFYQAYADYESLLSTTEEMLSGLVWDITGGSTKIVADLLDKSTGERVPTEIDFATPFRRISYMQHLQEAISCQLLPPEDPNAKQQVLDLCQKNGVVVKPQSSYGHLLDKLASHFIEPLMVQPTFLMDHPLELSPLAKRKNNGGQHTVTERFELFVAGTELCNAYTELNDPRDQRSRFEDQQSQRDQGDDEAQEMDESFCQALEYGLPPTGGWGLGIDRLAMLLTNNTHIRDVLLFPMMKPLRRDDSDSNDNNTQQEENTKE